MSHTESNGHLAQNLTLTVAEYASATSVEAIPPVVRERARQIVMDELACAVFGQTRTAGQLGSRYAAMIGGPGPCRILGTATRTTAPHAASSPSAAPRMSSHPSKPTAAMRAADTPADAYWPLQNDLLMCRRS